MAIFRVQHDKDYTVMSNHHLRDPALSLKAKGLLSQMLALPDDWDYSVAGLAYINREGVGAIRSAINELERAGYLQRVQGRGSGGKLVNIVYNVYEQPVCKNPTTDNPLTEKLPMENSTQQNKDKQSKDKINIDISNLILSREDGIGIETSYADYERLAKENIEYDHLVDVVDKPLLDELVTIIVETVCTQRKVVRIASDDYPAEMVKSKFLKLTAEHIEYVADCFHANTSEVRNIKQYLRAMLFNAPTTMDSYYAAKVAHDMAT
ncbi:DUF6017 domain-containing protein [Acutalibacter sp. 1XD8-36]|uniref:DUF6017 domain-containing protein n=1 Tax=Acutalibacter sp. 1XD8-36 TaxID=2320852 RepID=UPI001412AEF7|nr:DUF6017 domain-containing protein [Acutalibacter sp. 1XD8-36]NBJ90921.1 helix-turn-helix domain-containing protein [Acutalibacter sp. 1XD8-36]